MRLRLSECHTQLVVANVAPAAVRLVNAPRHVWIAADNQAVREQRVGVIGEQLLYDVDAIDRVTVLTSGV